MERNLQQKRSGDMRGRQSDEQRGWEEDHRRTDRPAGPLGSRSGPCRGVVRMCHLEAFPRRLRQVLRERKASRYNVDGEHGENLQKKLFPAVKMAEAGSEEPAVTGDHAVPAPLG